MDTMNLSSVRIITTDVARLAAFYEQITDVKATHYTEDFAELQTPKANLAIGSVRTLAMFGGTEVASPASNKSVIIEFRVEGLDEKYEAIKGVITDLVQPPTTMPWGNRSLLFRDLDGNLVNFFEPITAEAKARF
jgi:predicted enzyme related to lactoylglutathione lyase